MARGRRFLNLNRFKSGRAIKREGGGAPLRRRKDKGGKRATPSTKD